MVFDAITYLSVLICGVILCLDGRRTSYHLLGAGLIFLAVRFFGSLLIATLSYSPVWTQLIIVSQFIYGIFQSLIWMQILRLMRYQFLLISRTKNIEIPTDFVSRDD